MPIPLLSPPTAPTAARPFAAAATGGAGPRAAGFAAAAVAKTAPASSEQQIKDAPLPSRGASEPRSGPPASSPGREGCARFSVLAVTEGAPSGHAASAAAAAAAVVCAKITIGWWKSEIRGDVQ